MSYYPPPPFAGYPPHYGHPPPPHYGYSSPAYPSHYDYGYPPPPDPGLDGGGAYTSGTSAPSSAPRERDRDRDRHRERRSEQTAENPGEHRGHRRRRHRGEGQHEHLDPEIDLMEEHPGEHRGHRRRRHRGEGHQDHPDSQREAIDGHFDPRNIYAEGYREAQGLQEEHHDYHREPLQEPLEYREPHDQNGYLQPEPELRSHRDLDGRHHRERERSRSRHRGDRKLREQERRRAEREAEREAERRRELAKEAKRKMEKAVKERSRRGAMEAALTFVEIEEPAPQDLLRGMLENAAVKPGPDIFTKTLQCCALAQLRLEPQHYAKVLGQMLSRETSHAQIRAVLNMALDKGAKTIPLVADDLSREETRAAFMDADTFHEDGEAESEAEAEGDEQEDASQKEAAADAEHAEGDNANADGAPAAGESRAGAGRGKAKARVYKASEDATEDVPPSLELRDCEAMPELNGEYVVGEPRAELLGHERPIYWRTLDDDNEVCAYYWAGDADRTWMSGWWLAKEVAGEESLAYNPASSWTPPRSRWQVYFDGQRRPDPATFVLPNEEAAPQIARTPEEAEEALSKLDLRILQGMLTARTPNIAAYFGHFMALLHLEHLCEINQSRRRLLRHPLERLVQMGWSLKELGCMACYGRRESRKGVLPGWPDKGAEFASFAMPWMVDLDRLRIKRGDSVIVSRSDPLVDRVGEGTVVDIDQKKIVVNLNGEMPKDARQCRFRLDAYVNRTVYERQVTALVQLASGKDLDPIGEMIVAGQVGELDAWAKRAVVPPWRQQAHKEDSDAVKRREKSRCSLCAKLAGEDARGTSIDKAVLNEALQEAEAIRDLNDSQKGAVSAAIQRRCTIVQGPPGTGKTHVSVKIICLWAKQMGLTPLLATSDSNVAVDNIAEGLHLAGVKAVRVGRPEKVRGHLEDITLEAMVNKAKAEKKAAEAQKKAEEDEKRAAEAVDGEDEEGVGDCMEDVEDEDVAAERKEEEDVLGGQRPLLESVIDEMEELDKGKEKKTVSAQQEQEQAHWKRMKQRREDFDMRMQLLGEMDVVCCTAIAAGGDFLSRFNFHSILIDEVAQATEASSIVPIVLRGAKQVVLVGDQCQLPPNVLSREAQLRGLSLSIYQRLADAGIEPHFLDTQYRSHPKIVEFSAKCFYYGGLRSGVRGSSRPPPQGVSWPNPRVPVAFFEVGEDEVVEGESKANPAEADRVRDMVLEVLAQGELNLADIGIVTPYMAQVRALRKTLRDAVPQDRKSKLMEIASVDNFQGREKELIIFSAVRCNQRGNVGFLADWRRLNVMLTRARRGLVVFGAASTLRHDPHWQQWLEWCHQHQAVAKAPALVSKVYTYGGVVRRWTGTGARVPGAKTPALVVARVPGAKTPPLAVKVQPKYSAKVSARPWQAPGNAAQKLRHALIEKAAKAIAASRTPQDEEQDEFEKMCQEEAEEASANAPSLRAAPTPKGKPKAAAQTPKAAVTVAKGPTGVLRPAIVAITRPGSVQPKVKAARTG